MHLDPYFQEVSLVLLIMLALGATSILLRIPSAIGFLMAGVIVGPEVLSIVTKTSIINHLGAAGVVLLLFFVGMELSLQDLMREWKITILGTLLQIFLSVICVLGVGQYLDWPISRSILLGFVISLSSSAMVIKLLKDKGISKTRVGRDAMAILISQDIFVVPMLIIISFMGHDKLDSIQISKQVCGMLGLGLLIWGSTKMGHFKLPMTHNIRKDREIILLFCLSFSFGLALLSGMAELSTALGAFIAGGIITQLKLGEIFHTSLLPFQIVMTAIFFSSIGLLLDIAFFRSHYIIILSLTLLALVINTVINAFVLKILGRTWGESLLASSYLSQVGEFSFILAAIGLQQNVINEYSYQLTIYIIFFSIVLTPIWVKMVSLATIKIEMIEKLAIGQQRGEE